MGQREFAAADKWNAAPAKQVRDWVEAILLPGDEDKAKVRMPRPGVLIDAQDNLFFWILRAARHPDKLVRFDGQEMPKAPGFLIVPVGRGAIVLHVAGCH